MKNYASTKALLKFTNLDFFKTRNIAKAGKWDRDLWHQSEESQITCYNLDFWRVTPCLVLKCSCIELHAQCGQSLASHVYV